MSNDKWPEWFHQMMKDYLEFEPDNEEEEQLPVMCYEVEKVDKSKAQWFCNDCYKILLRDKEYEEYTIANWMGYDCVHCWKVGKHYICDPPTLEEFEELRSTNQKLRVFECLICGFVGLFDASWRGGRHSSDCQGITVFVGWLCNNDEHSS